MAAAVRGERSRRLAAPQIVPRAFLLLTPGEKRTYVNAGPEATGTGGTSSTARKVRKLRRLSGRLEQRPVALVGVEVAEEILDELGDGVRPRGPDC
jgi:hypothetical protein